MRTLRNSTKFFLGECPGKISRKFSQANFQKKIYLVIDPLLSCIPNIMCLRLV